MERSRQFSSKAEMVQPSTMSARVISSMTWSVISLSLSSTRSRQRSRAHSSASAKVGISTSGAALSKERPLPSDTVVNLDNPRASVTRPSQNATRHEGEAYVRLALELLHPEDRKVILLRQWEEKSFPEIGEELGVTEASARMRFNRALPKLGHKVAELRAAQGGDSTATESGST